MRRPLLLLILLGVPAPLAAQSGASRWTLTLGLDGVRFGAAARDTVGPAGAAAHLRPSGRIGVRAALQRHLGAWRLGLALGWADGEVEAGNDAVAIRDRTATLARYRAGAAVERRLARLGGGEVALELMPVVDVWSVDGITRTRAGAEAACTLRLPMGAVALENRLAVGLSASPLEEGDLGGEFELRPLRAVEFGVGVRVPL